MRVDASNIGVSAKKITRQISLGKIATSDRVTRSGKLDVEYNPKISLLNQQIKSPQPRPASAPDLEETRPAVYLSLPAPVLKPVQEIQADSSLSTYLSPPNLEVVVQPILQCRLYHQPSDQDGDQEQVFEQPNLEDLFVEGEEEEEEFDNDNYMAEERSIAPSTFSGSAVEDAEAWLRHFQNFCTYKGFNEAKSLALFKVLLTGNAAVWMDALEDEDKNNYTALTNKFTERYKSSDLVQYRSAKEIFTRRQRPDESVDDFCACIKKLATSLKADDKLVQYA